MASTYIFRLPTGKKIYEYRLSAEVFLHDPKDELPPAVGSKFTMPLSSIQYRILQAVPGFGCINYTVVPEEQYSQYKFGGSIEQEYFDTAEV